MLGLLLLLFASTPTAFHLEVSREGATRACPAGDVRARVVALLGRDPFVDAGPAAARFVVTTRSGPRWSALIRTSGKDTPGGVRRLRAPAGTCAALDETVALALALAIDPLGEGLSAVVGSGPDVDTVHKASSAERPRVREEATPAPRLGLLPSPEAPRLSRGARVGGRLGILVSSGLAPAVAFAPELGLTVSADPWRVELGGRFHTSSSRVGGLPTAVVVWALYADACFGGGIRVCAGLDGGAYRADSSRGGVRAHLAPGLALKLGLTGPSGWASGGAALEWTLRLSAPIWRQRLDVGGEAGWQMPGWTLGLGLGFTTGSGDGLAVPLPISPR